MAVELERKDGATMEYPVGRPFVFMGPSPCGQIGCEHPGCAFWYAEEKAGVLARFMAVLASIGVLLLLGMLLVFFTTSPKGSPEFPGMMVSLAIPVAGVGTIIGYLAFQMRDARTSLRELQEFREKGTVYGLPARQVFRKGRKG